MEIREKLAVLNRQRFKDWKQPSSTENAKPTMFAFTGDVYDGLDANTLDKRGIAYAQNHLRILSGLYGYAYNAALSKPDTPVFTRPGS